MKASTCPTAVTALLLHLLASTGPVAAQGGGEEGCTWDGEFCVGDQVLPCYRDPSNPNCDASCHCGSPNYPSCDPACVPGEVCDPSCGASCVEEFYGETCGAGDDHASCPSDQQPEVTFRADDGDDELAVLRTGPTTDCGIIEVHVTGHYELFNSVMAESCTHQLDETSYLTISNSCNEDGSPIDPNVEDMYVIDDADNTQSCSSNGDCGSGEICDFGRDPRFGPCCIPDRRQYVGTFFLVAGEANRVCLHHFCPEWERNPGLGHVNGGCSSTDSVHLKIDGTLRLCPGMGGTACPAGCGLPECQACTGPGCGPFAGGDDDGEFPSETGAGSGGGGALGGGDAGPGATRHGGVAAEPGCACRATPSGPATPGGAALLFGLLGLARRRGNRT